MRILFVFDSVEAPAAANPRLGRRLAAALAGMGQEVEILELWDGTHAPPPAAGCVTHSLPFADEAAMNRALENGAAGGTPIPLRLLRLAARPTAVGAAVRQFVLRAPRRVTATRKMLESLHKSHPYDAVCAVAAPYRAAFALEGAALPGARRLLWQMDPYAANESYRAPGGYDRERALLNALDHTFITAQAAPDYAPGGPLESCAGRVSELGFPSLVPAAREAPDPTLCAFCGTLYPGLRTPDALLRLFPRLDTTLTLVMAGGGWEAFGPQRAEAQAALGDRLQILGPVPHEQAAALERRAGVLISIGNTASNQLPSKLFEMFAAGKPVLHLAAGPRDAALPYLARWPLAFVWQSEADTPALRRWLAENAGRTLPFEKAETCFPEFTPGCVARQFLRAAAPDAKGAAE